MDIFQGLFNGFTIALSGTNIVFAFLGALLGTAIGVLPGLGPSATIALLLPLVYKMNSPVTGTILIAGIYYGAMYGGSTTSILLNLPGEAASVVTCIDGYQMAKNGRAGSALGIAAIGSFVAGTVGIVGLTFFGPPLAEFALRFGPPEYFSLMLLGLMLAIFLSGTSIIKGIISLIIGLLLATVGSDPVTGKIRFDFGIVGLQGGFDIVTVAMGIFGLGEIIYNLEQSSTGEIITTKIGNVFPTIRDLVVSKWAIIRGSILGFLVGVIPGGGPTIASLVSYALEKKCSRYPERFGKGVIEGVAGPETANNGASSGSFIPLLTLGIPSNAAIAMIFAGLLIQGITPGPFLISEHPEIFWGLIASMYIGNAMLLVLNLPLVGLWVQLLKVPFGILAPMVVLFTCIGVYSLKNSVFDVSMLVVFGIVGYLLRKLKFEAGPLIMAFVLGPLLENAFKQSLLVSAGNFSIFFVRPISGTFMAIFSLLIFGQMVKVIRSRHVLPVSSASQVKESQ